MQITLDVYVIDRRRGFVQVEDGRSLRIVATGDHHGRPCSALVASHMVALDVDGVAYAVDVVGMAAHPLERLVSSILASV